LLIDRVVVTDDAVEIRYVVPTTETSTHTRFCQLRTDYFNALPEAFRTGRRRTRRPTILATRPSTSEVRSARTPRTRVRLIPKHAWPKRAVASSRSWRTWAMR
jgi:hypothetical protein